MDTNTDNFGLRLRSLLERKRTTVDKFADDCGIARSTAHLWLKRATPVKDKYWPKLSEYFGVSENYVAYGRPDVSGKDYQPDETPAALAEEGQAAYGEIPVIEEELRAHLENLITLADGSRDRLGWISEQLQLHLTPPSHWRKASPVRVLKHGSLPSHTQLISTETGKPVARPERPTKMA